MTQLEKARKGEITPEIQQVADAEGLSSEKLAELVARGFVVVPSNKRHQLQRPCGIGKTLRTKVNTNIGTSPDFPDWKRELEKLEVALTCGTDTVMDLSTGGDLKTCRREILKRSPVPVGSVPIYEAAVRARERHGAVVKMSTEEIFQVIADHAADGIDFITIHCGVTRQIVERLKEQPRVMGIVSRGGAIMAGWMIYHDQENPLYAQFDRLLEIARDYDVTLSLGDGLRPGCLADATDHAQISELMVIGELVVRAREAGVQVMVEGPGHVPLDQIEANVKLQKRLCQEAPFYVLGPLVTDIAPGYDHIAGAIGGALAGAAGADFLCYLTPAEHLGLPTPEDVRRGVMATRLAAHVADLVKGIPGAWEWDLEMAKARQNLDWEKQLELALDPQLARQMRGERNPASRETCSMCGDYCAIDILKKYLGGSGCES
ncbi:MAG: Phosphomethylpyrimidine synthase [Thermoanaerobacterales bacterium 50_218]|nr:MAG: Phosphomethylpyrimidine synthase [Thermoanaerobacterales bacterium 50_218]HAA90509.1 phosphomethylpyrimidine synthase [Peptococcaceae bacterium]